MLLPERDGWLRAERLRQATNEYDIPPPPLRCMPSCLSREGFSIFISSSTRVELCIHASGAVCMPLFFKMKTFGRIELARTFIVPYSIVPQYFFRLHPSNTAICNTTRFGVVFEQGKSRETHRFHPYNTAINTDTKLKLVCSHDHRFSSIEVTSRSVKIA